MEEKRKRSPKVQEMDQATVNSSLMRQVATCLLTNTSIADCAKTLGISAHSVRTITEMPAYKELIESVSQAELGPLLAKAKSGLARLSTKAVKVIEKAMDSALDGTGSMREGLAAAQVALKATGIHEEKEAQQDATINIIMPTGTEPVTYEIKDET